MSELQAQKAYMRQKVQQRQQEAKLQQQAAAVCSPLAKFAGLCGCARIALAFVDATKAENKSADLKAVRVLQHWSLVLWAWQGRQRSASEASKHSMQQSPAQLEPSGQPEQPRVPMAPGPGRGQGRQGAGGRGQEAGRGRGRRCAVFLSW